MALGELRICGTKITLLATIFNKCTNLTTLTLSSNALGPEGGRTIAEALYNNKTLTHLHIWSNQIDSNVDLSKNHIGFEAGKDLAEALHKNTNLTSLFLSGNDIDSITFHRIRDLLKKNEERLIFQGLNNNNFFYKYDY
ncbi:20381_t:CDS:2 [Cetraspora pellucida]|uniref:20381_t:CDS:1 n=1 Tax=Cetraspora pellucida TaxID=1433469 RepID=A0A9N9DNV3_9GLOM|nr:20381_t:CDS:2 [Cetraspora pellucida]